MLHIPCYRCTWRIQTDSRRSRSRRSWRCCRRIRQRLKRRRHGTVLSPACNKSCPTRIRLTCDTKCMRCDNACILLFHQRLADLITGNFRNFRNTDVEVIRIFVKPSLLSLSPGGQWEAFSNLSQPISTFVAFKPETREYTSCPLARPVSYQSYAYQNKRTDRFWNWLDHNLGDWKME